MRYAIFSVMLICCGTHVGATDWLTLPSTYTHNPNGERVLQYKRIAEPTAPQPANFRSSGYTHTRSSLNYGQSSDHYHRVEKWGDPVRPYGEWRFPYRPYSTPYPNWGPPFGGLNSGFGFPPYGFAPFGRGYPGGRGYRGGHDGHPHEGHPHDGNGQPANPNPNPNAPPSQSNHPNHPYAGWGRGNRDFGWWNQGDWSNGPLLPRQPDGFAPYRSGPGTPYPVAPYYDGYYPLYRQ